MKNKHRPFISALLVLFVLTGALSCAQNTETAQKEPENAVTTEPVTEPQLKDNLPESDFNGYEFRILAFNEVNIKTIFTEEMDGNLVNDAVFEKLRAVEDRFNVNILLADGSDYQSTADEAGTVRREILANSDSFDIVQGHDITMANLSLEDYFIDVMTIPYLDFEQIWWPSSTIESMTVAGQMYLMSNNISYFNLGETRVIFFNKSNFDNLNITYPYEDVYNKKWTLDIMTGYAKQAYNDINGNGMTDAEDHFGFVNPRYYYCWLEPFQVEPYVKDAEGNLFYEFNLERIQTITENFYNLLFGGFGYLGADNDEPDVIFSEGRSMFIYKSLKTAVTTYSHSDVIYGILPMPMLDESEGEYFGGCTDRPIAVPITITDLERTGIIIEALNFESYKNVFPAYYEIALKSRYADQSDDANMIDIVHENVIMSFTYLFGNYASAYNNMFETLFNATSPSTDVASYAAKNENIQIKRIETLMKFYFE
ncbi:MAG: hypothetical protein PHZ09_07220 [Eubacteriales bacterium]|jgi:ABC-type glycerol-3-phosphate transport system substrate-binding protein|nr:hypothetical protein [Eubacteriales bacterium]